RTTACMSQPGCLPSPTPLAVVSLSGDRQRDPHARELCIPELGELRESPRTNSKTEDEPKRTVNSNFRSADAPFRTTTSSSATRDTTVRDTLSPGHPFRGRPMARVVCIVKNTAEGGVSFTWGDGPDSFVPYELDRQSGVTRLREHSDDARTQLNVLVEN